MSAAFAPRAFAAALLDPARPVPSAVGQPGAAGSARRFAVYRNNVVVSLTGALATRFPAARRIVGDEAFGALAAAFVRTSPPRSPVMATYGDGFADFVARAPDLDAAPYLADVVRLEAARTRAYHAADAEPIGPDAFATLDPDRLDRLVVALHPSVEIVRSRYPLVTIWAMNAGEAELGPIEDWSGQDALVARPAMEVTARRLPPGGGAFLEGLARGRPLGVAARRAARTDPDFDLTRNLIGLVEAGLAVGFTEAPDRSAP